MGVKQIGVGKKILSYSPRSSVELGFTKKIELIYWKKGYRGVQ